MQASRAARQQEACWVLRFDEGYKENIKHLDLKEEQAYYFNLLSVENYACDASDSKKMETWGEKKFPDKSKNIFQ